MPIDIEQGKFMLFTIFAACMCNKGKIRGNNEDNFSFNGRFLPEKNQGIPKPLWMVQRTTSRIYLAVYDGMGGENFGETASFIAAKGSLSQQSEVLCSEEEYLEKLALRLSAEVAEQGEALVTNHMGTTMAAVSFCGEYAYICNVGDSRVYLLRDGQLLQLSVDHVSIRSSKSGKKGPLTQYLGVNPEEMRIEPSTSRIILKENDRILICSDGVTDMLSDKEILHILKENPKPAGCVWALTEAALGNGGRDNITTIVCNVIG